MAAANALVMPAVSGAALAALSVALLAASVRAAGSACAVAAVE
jgi:hypothetical protein